MALATIPYPNLDPVLLHIWGPFAIRWYALSYIAGLLLGWWLIVRMLADSALWANPVFKNKAPATADDIGDFFVWATLGVIVGGRLGWVIFYATILCSVSPGMGMCHGYPERFLTDPISLISAWDGGMSFHGGLIGVAVATWLFCRKRKISLIRFGDLLASVVPIGLFFGRIANFVNGELWGKPTDVPWAMVFCNDTVRRLHDGICPAGTVPRHPSELYEAALEGALLFLVVQFGYRRLHWRENPGLTIGVFLLVYGLARGFCELFREPDAPFLGPISMGQALSAPMFLIGLWLLYETLYKKRFAA